MATARHAFLGFSAFLWRRIHSLAGLWLSLFLIQHLITNSQSALLLGHDGEGFIKEVNFIHSLPYLPVIEIALLGAPILIHALFGFFYLRTAKFNSFATDGSSPSLTMYRRNKRYTWQRITSWILVLGIFLHVAHMRFVRYPASFKQAGHQFWVSKVSFDEGLVTVADRLKVKLYDQEEISLLEDRSFDQGDFLTKISPISLIETETEYALLEKQRSEEKKRLIKTLKDLSLKKDQIAVVAQDFGTVELLIVRDAFKSFWVMIAYTLFVLAATFHGFNGIWTFLITWGVTLTERSQKFILKISSGLIGLMTFLGLASIWLTYWVNLFS